MTSYVQNKNKIEYTVTLLLGIVTRGRNLRTFTTRTKVVSDKYMRYYYQS